MPDIGRGELFNKGKNKLGGDPVHLCPGLQHSWPLMQNPNFQSEVVFLWRRENRYSGSGLWSKSWRSIFNTKTWGVGNQGSWKERTPPFSNVSLNLSLIFSPCIDHGSFMPLSHFLCDLHHPKGTGSSHSRVMPLSLWVFSCSWVRRSKIKHLWNQRSQVSHCTKSTNIAS